MCMCICMCLCVSGPVPGPRRRRRVPGRPPHPVPLSKSLIRVPHPSPSPEPLTRVSHPSPSPEPLIRVPYPESLIRVAYSNTLSDPMLRVHCSSPPSESLVTGPFIRVFNPGPHTLPTLIFSREAGSPLRGWGVFRHPRPEGPIDGRRPARTAASGPSACPTPRRDRRGREQHRKARRQAGQKAFSPKERVPKGQTRAEPSHRPRLEPRP